MPKIAAFQLGLAVWLDSAEPGQRHEISNSEARPRYGCNAGDGDISFL